MHSFRVKLGHDAHPVYVGAGALEQTGRLARKAGLAAGRALIVTDANVARLFGERVTASLAESGFTARTLEVAPGEQSKSFATLEQVFDAMVEAELDRTSTVFALGGGVVGDLAGFAAATYMRGVALVQIPTTMVAQVDSSLGGKTAINHPRAKNLIGAFYQPRLVLADTSVLGSLPRRELLAGYAEIVKYGLIRDAEFFAWLEADGHRVCALAPEALRHSVLTSCAMKAEIVAGDEREEGDRALLNFGHTFGHALETETGFSSRLLHGEAVALGMVLATDLAVKLDLVGADDALRVRRHLADCGLPTRLAEIGLDGIPAERLLGHMSKDKKVRDGRITLILPRRIGDAFVMKNAPIEKLREFLTPAAA